MRVYTHVDAVLGPKRSFTPEGYLFCEDVPLARTGIQMYLPRELEGIPAGDDGLIYVERRAEDVFSDKALASFVAKPFTDNHPPDNLNPKTYRDHVHGSILNPRRGTGEYADMMVGDILVCDHRSIQAIQDGKREVSCGYTAEYEILGPGRARQFDIIGNHVALVDRGRCGGRCAVGDHDVATEQAAVRVGKVTWKERAKAAALVQDTAALDAALAEAEGGGGGVNNIHVHLVGDKPGRTRAADEDGDKKDDDEDDDDKKKDTSDSMAKLIASAVKDGFAGFEKRLVKLEGKKVADEESEKKDDDDEDGDKKDKKETSDKAPHYTADQLPDIIQDTKARAEILIPGIRLPGLDAKGDPKVMTDMICDQRRKALTAAMFMPKSQEAITPLMANQPAFDRMTCDQIATIFTAASENMKMRNKSGASYGGNKGAGGNVRKIGDQEFSGPVTPEEINARNRKFNQTARGIG